MIQVLQKLYEIATTKKYTTPYINWLTFANAGMLNKGNIYSINFAISNIKSKSPVIEIGSFCGLSTNLISHTLRVKNKTNIIYTADKWMFEGAEKDNFLTESCISHKEYREFVKNTYIRNVGFFSKENLPYTIEDFSDDFFRKWENQVIATDIFGRNTLLGGPISFCYIDGNHTYEYAKRDFENTDKFLEVGGFVLFDDSADSNPFGLTKLMREIERNGNYLLALKNPNYLFQKIS